MCFLRRATADNTYRETIWYRWPLVWLLTANIALLVGCLAQWGVFESVELKTYDWRLHQGGVKKPRAPIVIIAIDQASYEELSQSELQVFWGSRHAKMLHILSSAGAKAIGLDLYMPVELTKYFETKSAVMPEQNPEQKFAQTISVTPNLVMVFKRDLMPNGQSKDIFSSRPLNTALALGGGTIGFDKTSPDADGIVRRFTAKDIDGRISFPLALASFATGKEPVFKNGELALGPGRIPLNDNDEGLIAYLGPDGTFPRIPYTELLNHPDKYRSRLKGSICLIGYTTYESQDYHSVPFANSYDGKQQNFMAGVEVHANVLHTLLAGPFIAQPGPAYGWGLIVLAAFLVVPLTWWPRTIFVVPTLFLVLLGWVLLCLLAFVRWNLDLPLVAVAMALALSQIATIAVRLWQENQSKRWIEDAMGRYVSPEVVNYLRQSPDALTLGGHRQEVTVLFSDIRSFTALSESLSPEQVTRFLNDYLNEMVEIIFANGGTVDKFIGDGIMVIYNWPLPQPDHAMRALRTAIEMQQMVTASQQRWNSMGLPSIEIGVGIHTGPAVLGNIGSTRRMEQTAIGDTVNVASRIEGLCKTLGKSLGSGILFSETTYNAAKVMQLEDGKFPFEVVPAAQTEVRGRREALQLLAVCQRVEANQVNET